MGDPNYEKKLRVLILDTFEDVPSKFSGARLAWHEGRMDDCRNLLHASRSAIGMLGAKQFSALSLAIENEILAGQVKHIEMKFEAAERSLNDTTSFAKSWLEKQGIPEY